MQQGTNDSPLRVVMLGPLPPLTGGMVSVVDNLRRSALARQCELIVINNGKVTRSGRWLIVGVAAQLKLLGRLAGSIIRQRTQIVHIHTCASPVGFWRDCFHVWVSRLLGCKVILHIHDGSCERFIAARRAVGRAIILRTLETASTVVVLSRSSLKSLQPIAPALRWRVLPNGVSLSPHHARKGNGKARFLFLGNYTKRKGAYDLVDAAAAAVGGGLAGRVYLAGAEKEPGQEQAMQHYVAGRGCRSSVRIMGLLRGERKEKALSSADCLVLPSYAEALPMSILEGMAHGLAVIATRVGSIPEMITDGREGFLIDPGDVRALADRMMLLDSSADLRARMGLAARRRIEQAYSIDVVAERLMAIYREALGEAGDKTGGWST